MIIKEELVGLKKRHNLLYQKGNRLIFLYLCTTRGNARYSFDRLGTSFVNIVLNTLESHNDEKK